MSGPKRNPDKLNTIGIVVVGICSAVLVYVTIVALQAFYMDDTSEIQTMADYGGQDTQAKSIRAQQMMALKASSTPNAAPQGPKQVQTFRIPIEYAMKKVVDGARVDPGNLVPAIGRSDKPTVLPTFGRPKQIPTATPPSGAGSAADPGTGSGAIDTAPQPGGQGSGAPTTAPTTPPTTPPATPPKTPATPPTAPKTPATTAPKTPATTAPKTPTTTAPKTPTTTAPKTPANAGSAAKGNAR